MSEDKYIAFDVHQATTVVSVMNAGGGEIDAAILATQPQALMGFLGGKTVPDLSSPPIHRTFLPPFGNSPAEEQHLDRKAQHSRGEKVSGTFFVRSPRYPALSAMTGILSHHFLRIKVPDLFPHPSARACSSLVTRHCFPGRILASPCRTTRATLPPIRLISGWSTDRTASR